MWKRFIRALRALFGGVVKKMEDPQLILEQNIRELDDQIPKMNANLATIKAQVNLFEKDLLKYEAEEKDLTAKIRAAINQNRDDIAAEYALRLERARTNVANTRTQLETAKAAFAKAEEVAKAFRKERERKIAEAKEAIRAHQRSKQQAKIADTMEQFEVGGIAQTHDEMIQRINEQTAQNEARVDIALNSVDTAGMKIDEEAEKLRAAELIKQFKTEMGLGTAATNSSPSSATEQPNSERTRDSL